MTGDADGASLARADGPAVPPDHGPAHPWWCCVVPMLVYLGIGMLEPTRDGGGLAGWLGVPYPLYPCIYAVRLVATCAALAVAWPAIRGWLGRPCWWPPVVGLALVIPWVVLATMQREAGWLAGGSGRSGFDPFVAFSRDPRSAWIFLAARGLGLVLLAPLVEELFVRGFLMRFAIRESFWQVPFGEVTAASAATLAVYAVVSHPAEAVAALGWFAVVTGIAAATRRPIDCILAHAATNLALGAHVLATGAWWLL